MVFLKSSFVNFKKKQALAMKQIFTPDEIFKELFYDIQTSHIFKDSKTFTDATPKVAPNKIVEQYLEIRQSTDFNLLAFVKENFTLPKTYNEEPVTKSDSTIREYIDLMWNKLTRAQDTIQLHSSLIALPKPYIVPGGRFREIYYWDSFFTMLGLTHSGHTDLAQNMLSNFAYLIDHVGFIPNGNRTYYSTRSQVPMFSLMVELMADVKGDDDLYRQYLPQLQKEYDFWMNESGTLSDKKPETKRVVKVQNALLNRYWDSSASPRQESYIEDIELAGDTARKNTYIYRDIRAAAESGWDFSSRWFSDAHDMTSIQTTHVLPVDLNSCLYNLENVLSKAYSLTENQDKAAFFENQAQTRKHAIQTLFFDTSNEVFQDLWLPDMTLGKTLSLATAFPLYFNIATPEQAKQVVHKINELLLKDGGWVTTNVTSGQQWDAPNGWAPLQWITYIGMKNYGFHEEAKHGALRWVKNNISVYKQTGKLLEKYNVEDIGIIAGGGEYDVQDGFGWTNAILLKLMDELNVDT
jgi:alpha,alpha-trehalase